MSARILSQEFIVMVPRQFGAEIHEIPICGLCGNGGVVDTRGKVTTPFGVATGLRAYCICPNGRTMKRRKLPL